MYKCTNCGNLFKDGEQKKWKEDVGEYWGSRCYESFQGCPLCGEPFEEVKPCKLCGGYESMESGEEVCEDCKKDLLKRFHEIIDKEFSVEECEELSELLDIENIF